MKSIILYMALALIPLISITSCTNNNSKSQEQTGKEYTSKYICPMHCEGSGSDTTGACPVCGMDYILNENKNK